MDRPNSPEVTSDFMGEDRHEYVQKLAYQFWEKRGRPLGSPEVDWFGAEQVLYLSLLASGMIDSSANDGRDLGREIYS